MRLLRRAAFLLRARRHDDELAEEIAFHREMKKRDLERSGVPPAEVEHAARRALGNELASRQYARDVWISPFVQECAQDARFAVRVLMRDRGFALTALFVLGCGIGVNNMLFTILNAHTIRGLPVHRADRLLHISTFDQRAGDRGVSFPEFQDLRAATTTFSGLAAFFSSPLSIGDRARAPERRDSAYVSPNAFDVLGIQPLIGRTFTERDDAVGASPVVLLGSAVWESRYGRDPAILGREILINGSPASVIGVIAPRSGFPSTAEVWLPLSRLAGVAAQKRDARTLRVFGRVKDTLSPLDAQAEVEAIVAGFAREYPDTSRGVQARVVPLNERLLGRLTDPAWLAFIAVGFLSLIVSGANVANLLLARAVHRAREVAIRSSLGASRARVVRQLLIESAVLAAIGSAVGIVVSFAGVRVFRMAIPPNTLPYWMDYEVNLAVLAALVGASLAAVLIVGLVPALYASKPDVNRVLKAGGRGVIESRGPRRWTTGFITVQIGLAVVMLSFLVIDVRAPEVEFASDAIIDTNDVLTGTVTLPAESYPTAENRRAFYRRLDERLHALPEVSSAALVSTLPRGGAIEQQIEVQGQPQIADESSVKVWTVAVGPEYFKTLALPLARGREFTQNDAAPRANSVIVNRRLADLFFPGNDPLGQSLRLADANKSLADSPWRTIIGVAEAVRQRPSLSQEPLVYVPIDLAAPATATFVMRSHAPQSAVAARIREEIVTLDPNLPVYRVLTMSQVIDNAEWVGRVSSRTVRFITLLAFAFSLVGLYAATAHAVAERTNEIGVRVALGARPVDLGRMVLAHAGVQVALGLVFGLLGSIAWDAAFFSGRIDRKFADPAVLGPTAAVLAIGAFAACLLPARRAARLDPVVALRNE